MGGTKWEFWTAWRQWDNDSHIIACDPSPLEEGSRDGHIATMLSAGLCSMETRKKMISENGMQHWIRNTLAEILNATSLSWLLTLGLGTIQAIFIPGYHPATLKMCGVPSMHQIGILTGTCRLPSIRTYALFSFPNFLVSQGGGKGKGAAMLRS